MQAKWQVRDLIDLEYFLNQTPNSHSKAESADDLSADRRRYLSYEKTHQPPFTRRNLIKYWLEEKQTKNTLAGTDQTPGKAYTETVRLLRSLIIIISFISGAGLAWSVLSYSGTTPVNIFTCIWALIAPQFILMAALAISMMFSSMGFPHSFNGLYPLIAALLQRLTKWVSKRAKTAEKNFTSADQRMHLYALTGLIGRQKTIYGSAFFWPVYILAQIFGVSFNLGILLALLLKLAITDLAFGWQSTLLPDPAIVYRMVDIFAWPWSWISSAHPTIEQIQGSRMILKEGMMHLTTPDLVSWWPFLCFSILCYGLVPRLLLLLMGLWQQNRALKRVSFSTGTCDRLIQRMQTPHVQSAGRAYSSKSKPAAISVQTDTAVIPTDLKTAILTNPAIVLVPEDIDGKFNDEDLNERIAHILGLKVVRRIRIEMGPTTDITALDTGLSRNSIPLEGLRTVVLMEAWQPPIRETISWLNSLRNGLKKDTGIIIALIGKPANQMIFTSPDNTDRVIWEKTVNSMGDPFMRVENIGG